MNAPTLRPLGIGEILDVGIKIYWRNAWTLFRIVVFVVLPAQILVGIIQVSALPNDVNANFNYSFSPGIETTRNDVSGSEATTFAVGFAVALIVNALAGKLLRPPASARWQTRISASRSGGARRSLRAPAVPGRRCPEPASTIFIGLGTIACLIPGIYLWGAFFVAIPVLLVEGARPMRALGARASSYRAAGGDDRSRSHRLPPREHRRRRADRTRRRRRARVRTRTLSRASRSTRSRRH